MHQNVVYSSVGEVTELQLILEQGKDLFVINGIRSPSKGNETIQRFHSIVLLTSMVYVLCSYKYLNIFSTVSFRTNR